MKLREVAFICCTYMLWIIFPVVRLDQIVHHISDVANETGNVDEDENVGGEVRLLRQLMTNYDRDVRPMKNSSNPVVIRLGITLTQIFDLDEKNQVLMTSVWLDMEWIDDYLSWNPDDFGGMTSVRIPCERLWLPDIVLYNNADDYTQNYMNSKAKVTSDGNVFWPPPTKMRSKCPVDVTYFPFDQQSCELKLGSWIYDGFQVDVTNRSDQVDITNYLPNGEWELIETKVKRNVVYYPCCPEPFPDVTITIVIRRKTLYYISNVILPCVMMSGLTLLVFRLPPDAGEKIVLGFTVLLAFSVFILNIGEKMPETSNSVPLIAMYLTAVMAITSMSITMTVVVLSYHYGGQTKSPPRWLKWLVYNRLGYLLCSDIVHRVQSTFKLNEKASLDFEDDCCKPNTAFNSSYLSCSLAANTSSSTTTAYCSPSCGYPQCNKNCCYSHLHSTTHELSHSFEKENDFYNSFECQLDLEFLKMLVLMINKHNSKQIRLETLNEWRTIALALDRFLFWAFLLAVISSSAIFLLALPYYRIGE